MIKRAGMVKYTVDSVKVLCRKITMKEFSTFSLFFKQSPQFVHLLHQLFFPSFFCYLTLKHLY